MYFFIFQITLKFSVQSSKFKIKNNYYIVYIYTFYNNLCYYYKYIKNLL